MPTRGVLYLVWGDHGGLLDRSIESVRQSNPGLPVNVHWIDDPSPTLLLKAQMNKYSPYDTTLFLDTDTVVLGDVTYGFEQAERHSLACCICECPHATRYADMPADSVEYNTGVVFWSRCAATTDLFHRWRGFCEMDSSIEWSGRNGETHRMPMNDQGPFARAVMETQSNPYVLPLNWNFRPRWYRSWFGSIKIWHDYSDPPRGITSRHPMEFCVYAAS